MPETGPQTDPLETRVAAMAKIGSCFGPSFAAGGDRLAFVGDLGGLPQVWTAASGGGWPDLATALDDQVTGVSWSPDGEWLACSVAPGGGLNQQVHVLRTDGTGLRRVTDGGRENNWLTGWARDGSGLMVASNRRDPASMDAYLLDPLTGAWRLVAETGGIGSLTDVSADGRRAVVYRMRSRGDNDLVLVDLATGEQFLLTPHEGPGTFTIGRFSPDGRTVYLSSNANRELLAFARVRLDPEGRPGPVEVIAERSDAELAHAAVTPDGSTAALAWNVAGRSELALLDLETLEATPGPTLPADLAGSLTFSQDGRRLALVAWGAAAPSDVWVLERATGALAQVTRSPHAGVDLSSLVRPAPARFRSFDGLELSGWLYRPAGSSGPGPTVLSFHGGPEGQEVPAFRRDYQALLSQGVAVFAPNVRGSSGFGKTFVNLDNGPLRFDAIRDIEACWRFVVDSGVADPAKVGIMGGSYGGYMTMAGLVEYPELFAAGANLYGIVNFLTFFEHAEPWMGAISRVEYGDPDTQADMLRALSPITRIERVRAPTLVLHGANDTNVPVVEAEQTVAALRARGVPVELVLFPDEGHGFTKAANRVTADVAVTRWFVQHLGNAG